MNESLRLAQKIGDVSVLEKDDSPHRVCGPAGQQEHFSAVRVLL
jgi:hypothetical protein